MYNVPRIGILRQNLSFQCKKGKFFLPAAHSYQPTMWMMKSGLNAKFINLLHSVSDPFHHNPNQFLEKKCLPAVLFSHPLC